MAKFEKAKKIQFDGYEFNPEIAWPKISIKPNYFVSYLSYQSRSNCRADAYIKNADGTETRIVCSVCATLLTPQEVTDKKTKCPSCMNLDNNKQSGQLSSNSKKRLQLAFDWLCLLSQQKKAYNEKLKSWYQFKIAMLTVKLPCEELKHYIDKRPFYQRHIFNIKTHRMRYNRDLNEEHRQTDLYIKSKILNNFLTQLRSKFNVNMYIWRAERGADGILHFHIIHDQFLPYQQINKIWNKILDTHGYIDKYRKNQQEFHKNGFKFNQNHSKHWDRQAQIKAYKKGVAENWSNPTGTTDIHSVRNIRNTKAYLAKYLQKPSEIEKLSKMMLDRKIKERKNETITEETKKELLEEIKKKFTIEGNLWYVSQSLSRLKSILVDVDETLSALCQKIFDESPGLFFQSDYCRIFKVGIKEIISKKFTPLINVIREKVNEIRKQYYPVSSRLYSTLGIPLQLSF